MNIDPVEVFGEELMTPARKGDVIAQLQRIPVSEAIKVAAYMRWCELLDVKVDAIDLRAVRRKVSA